LATAEVTSASGTGCLLPLTTIRIPHYDVGTRAAELLMAPVAEPSRNPETVLLR
jgi:DNA-binding LacI/PurR family transcriptional regulator